METVITKDIEFDLESNDEMEEKEVEFYVEFHVENDGIGSYEFWGNCGYDAGNDYIEIDNITYDRDEYTEEECKIIDKFIEEYNDWEEDIELSEPDEPEYEPEDYDD